MAGLHKNFNIPWLIVTSLAVWFFFVHLPPFWISRNLLTRDVLLAVHIVGAGTLYFACAHNCLFTPSFTVCGKPSTFRHTWIGRVGMVSGIVSFPLGAYLAWSRLGKDGVSGTSLGFSIPITIGGIAQVLAQYYGYTAIKRYKSLKEEITAKVENNLLLADSSPDSRERHEQELQELRTQQNKSLRRHVEMMIGLFASACGIPAVIRLAEVLTGLPDGVATVIALIAIIGLLYMVGRWYTKVMMPPAPEMSPSPTL